MRLRRQLRDHVLCTLTLCALATSAAPATVGAGEGRGGGGHAGCKVLAATPVPTVLLSSGRSGSTLTWLVMGYFTAVGGGSKAGETPATEYTGSNVAAARKFFQKHRDDVSGEWAYSFLCEAQKKHSGKAGMVGFKWKPLPFRNLFLPPAQGFLQSLGPSATRGHVKIVRLRRNPIDVQLSAAKHGDSSARARMNPDTTRRQIAASKTKPKKAHCR